MKLTQEDGDKLVMITQGKYKGHEGIIRTLETGEVAIYVLEHNEKNKGPVRVIDIIKLENTTTEDPQLH